MTGTTSGDTPESQFATRLCNGTIVGTVLKPA